MPKNKKPNRVKKTEKPRNFVDTMENPKGSREHIQKAVMDWGDACGAGCVEIMITMALCNASKEDRHDGLNMDMLNILINFYSSVKKLNLQPHETLYPEKNLEAIDRATRHLAAVAGLRFHSITFLKILGSVQTILDIKALFALTGLGMLIENDVDTPITVYDFMVEYRVNYFEGIIIFGITRFRDSPSALDSVYHTLAYLVHRIDKQKIYPKRPVYTSNPAEHLFIKKNLISDAERDLVCQIISWKTVQDLLKVSNLMDFLEVENSRKSVVDKKEDKLYASYSDEQLAGFHKMKKQIEEKMGRKL